MEKKIITVSREFGSGGRTVGKMLAERLGIAYYDKELVKQISMETGFDPKYIEEHGEHAPGKSILSYIFGVRAAHPDVMNGMTPADFLWCMQRKIILELAEKESCVIVGRCADYILREMEGIHLFKIFVHASMESRIKRCIERAPEGENYTEKELEKHIKRVDRNRSNYYADFTLQKWGDKSNYDICINTTNVQIDEIVQHLSKLFFD